MPAFETSQEDPSSGEHGLNPASHRLRFPPVTREQIMNCSYDSWYPKFGSWCFKSKIIPLPQEVVEYLREDGILLADETTDQVVEEETWQATVPNSDIAGRIERLNVSDSDSDTASAPGSDDGGETAPVPPDRRFPEFHQQLEAGIAELGGSVAPKLNWSAPKDATYMSRYNTMRCITANDVYLLLKSSSFVNHDLDHAFDGCAGVGREQLQLQQQQPSGRAPENTYRPVLVLREHVDVQPSLEFRCFVKHRRLVAVTQRDLGFYDWLPAYRDVLLKRISFFFEQHLCFDFPDDCFAFDVYIPEDRGAQRSLGKLRLVDINPWSPKTDTLLFGWHELLEMQVPRPILGSVSPGHHEAGPEISGEEESSSEAEATDNDNDDDDGGVEVDFRIVENDDQAAYNFSAGQYSAHKLPREVVDATQAGQGGMREFMRAWNDATGGMGGTMWQQGGRT